MQRVANRRWSVVERRVGVVRARPASSEDKWEETYIKLKPPYPTLPPRSNLAPPLECRVRHLNLVRNRVLEQMEVGPVCLTEVDGQDRVDLVVGREAKVVVGGEVGIWLVRGEEVGGGGRGWEAGGCGRVWGQGGG